MAKELVVKVNDCGSISCKYSENSVCLKDSVVMRYYLLGRMQCISFDEKSR